jgi:hypothetical protein
MDVGYGTLVRGTRSRRRKSIAKMVVASLTFCGLVGSVLFFREQSAVSAADYEGLEVARESKISFEELTRQGAGEVEADDDEEDVNMQQLSLQRPTMRGDDLRGSIFAPAIPARVHHMSSSDGAMLGPEPILPDHAAQMPFNLQQPQALSEAAAGESSSVDESEKPHLSSLGATEMGSELPVHKFVHHHVDDVFQDALDHELSRVKVDAARKEAEDENVKYEFLAEKLAKSLEAELAKYSSGDLNVWVPYEENGEEFWYPMTPNEWMQYIEELLKYRDYFEKEHPGFFKDLLNDLRAIAHSLHPDGKHAKPAENLGPVKPMVITTKAPLVSTMAPVDVIPVKVTRSTGSPIEETNPPVHPVAVHIASEPAPESAPNDQYKSLAKMVINQAVGSVEKELKEGIEKREKALERKLSLSAEKTLEERMHKIVRRDLAAFAKQAGDVEQADSTTEAEAEEAAATTAAAAKKAAATTGAEAKKAAATTAAAAKKMEPKTKVDTSLHAALPAQNMKKKAAVYHVQLAHSAHTLTGKALHAPTAAAVLPKSQQTMLRQQVIEQALHKAEKTVAQRVAADVGAAMAATRKSKHNLQAELAKAQHTVESRVAADLHHAMRAGPKAEITSLSSHTGSEASTDDLLGFADQSF